MREHFQKRLRHHLPELDSLRGIAVLMVVAYHALFWSYPVDRMSGVPRALLAATQPGWLGVDLFFVLSGFLITGILIENPTRPDYYRRFYRRRALRILPAYVACILLLLALGYIHGPFAFLSAFFFANMAALFSVGMEYGPFWSLAVEEHFYLAWPTVCRHLSQRRLLALAVAIIVVSPVLRALAFTRGDDHGLFMYTWFRLDGLAMGAALALLLRAEWMTTRRAWFVVIGAALLAMAMLIVGAPFGILTRSRPVGAALQFTPWSLLFFGAIGASVLVGSTRSSWMTHSRILGYFGSISYGLYLIHMLVMSVVDGVMHRAGAQWRSEHASLAEIGARFLIVVVLSVAIAHLSRRTLEEYFLRRKDDRAPAPGTQISDVVDSPAIAMQISPEGSPTL